MKCHAKQLIVLAAVCLQSIVPSPAWTPDEFENREAAKPQMIGQYRYVPELNKKNPHNVLGFKLFKGNKLILSDRFKVASIEECKYLVCPYQSAEVVSKVEDGYRRFSTIGDTAKRIAPINKLADGTNDTVLVATYWGGMKGAYTYQPYTLGSKVTKGTEIDSHSSEFQFGDFSHNGHLQAIGFDPTYEYWNASAASSAYPGVFVELRNGRLHLVLEKMRGAALTQQQFNKLVAEEKKQQAEYADDSPTFGLSSNVLVTMIEMIYSGHADQAWKYLDAIWPKGKLAGGITPAVITRQDFIRAGAIVGTTDMTKQRFRTEFRKRIQLSPYWTDLVALNKGSL